MQKHWAPPVVLVADSAVGQFARASLDRLESPSSLLEEGDDEAAVLKLCRLVAWGKRTRTYGVRAESTGPTVGAVDRLGPGKTRGGGNPESSTVQEGLV
ncbi:hypothetical protein GCM10009672_22140 [Nesterenkonia lutea]